MTAVEFAGVSLSYGETTVVRSIDLAVPEGSRTVIVGSSGSGKTTILRLLSGFERPDTGTITVAGKEVAGARGFVPAHLRRIGYVSQDGSLFPHLTVGENVAFGLKEHGRGRDKAVHRLLASVFLEPDLATRRPDQLSGGQQQRVALARALAFRPRVMLLDEPFSALDAGLRAETRDSVAQLLSDEGITSVLVTHDQAEALAFAHQLAILREGSLAQVGTPRELYAHPVDLRTGQFLGDAIVVEGTVRGTSAECALGTVDVWNTAAEGAAHLLLRPEQLTLDREHRGPSGSSVPFGVVEAASFYGANVVLTVRLGSDANGGTADAVIRVPQLSNDNPPVGSAVRISVRGSAMAYSL